jgi:hypothetical protein
VSSQINTDRQSFAANTATSTTISNIPATIINYLSAGQGITGTGIPVNTVIVSVNTGAFSIVISNATTTTVTGAAINTSGFPSSRSFSFVVPFNSSSISYTVTALPEAGFPESYIDDVIIQLTSNIILTGSVTVPKNNNTDWATPPSPFSGTLNTNTTYSGFFKRIGGDAEYDIKLAFSGTPNSGVIDINLPTGHVMDISKMSNGSSNNFEIGTGSFVYSGSGIAIKLSMRYMSSTSFRLYYIDTSAAYAYNSSALNSTTPLTILSGDSFTLKLKVPIVGWSANESVNVAQSFSQAALAQIPDSYLQMNGFAGGLASTATAILYLTSNTIIKNEGDAIQYVSDSVNGDKFIALRDGIYTFNLSNDFGTPSTALGLTKNTTQLTTLYQSLTNSSERLMTSNNADVGGINWSGKLVAGDILRLHNVNTTGFNIGYASNISITYQGSLKQVNPQLNNKITIPTHQLRFEGSSSRGSTDTAIVKFDTQAVTSGDAWSVTNTAANGTVVTILKAGRLNVSTSMLASIAQNYYISKNQAVLTGTPQTGSESLGWSSTTAAGVVSVSATTDVVVGDKIRIVSTAASSADPRNIFTLILQEQSFPLAISNVWQQNGSGFDQDNVLLQLFDTASLGDFTQTGLAFVIANALNGAKSAQLIHQAAVNQSFKQVFQVSPKFRGKNLTLKHDIVSTCTSGNLTLTVYDETNSATLVNASQVPTNSQSVVATVTNTSNTLTAVSNAVINTLSVGMKVTGTNIPSNSYITALSASAGTITISQAATGAGTSVRISGVVSIQKVSFDVPASCGSLSYTFTSLPENLCETYIDGMSVDISSQVLTTTSATVSSTPPTVQKFTSGSGTYTTPTNVSYIKIRMIGGGGSGSSNSTINTAGNNGTATTFGSSLLLANGGFGGISGGVTGGAGGTASLGVGPIGTAVKGNSGASATYTSYAVGALGGVSVFGGMGTGGNPASGSISTASLDNSGSGGSGGAGSASVIAAGSGGGAGGYIEAIIFNPSSTYAYTIGAGGAAVSSGGTLSGAGGSGYIEVTEYYASSATIPLSTAQLVQQPDSSITVDTYLGYGSTGTRTLRYTTVRQNIGSAIQYISDAVNGDRFVILQEGLYNCAMNWSSAAASDYGMSRNASSLVTSPNALAESENIFSATTGVANYGDMGSSEVYCYVGDIIRAHADSAIAGNRISKVTISYKGSMKLLNPSTDSKITIPTHQLRFEGASTRGSTDTFIVKFDTQTITQGDAWDVVSNTANGTVVTMKKSGKLSLTGQTYLAAAGEWGFSLNQAVNTTSPSNSEVLSRSYCNIATGIIPSGAWTGDVKIGDKIRAYATVTPASTTGISINLSLTETSIPANFSNVLPQWSQSDSSIRVMTGNGFGSTNTSVRRFSSTLDNVGSSITYADSASLGASFIINEDGVYSFSYSDVALTGNATVAVVKNAITFVTDSNLLSRDNGTGANSEDSNLLASSGVYLIKGDTVRVVSNTPSNISSAATTTMFTISKVGKPNLTSVDVTPFVNMKTTDVESLFLNSGATFTASVITGSLSKNTNKGILSYNSTTGIYTALKKCDVTISFFAQPSAASKVELQIRTASTMYAQAVTPASGGDGATTSASIEMEVGDNFYCTLAVGTSNAQRVSVLATADNGATAAPTQQVSSDTMNFVFKATVIDGNVDSIGTYNTYTYTGSTNTKTISVSAPTQTNSNMNIQGFQLTTRGAYSSATNTATPARIDIFIGKGLENVNYGMFKDVGATIALSTDAWNNNTGNSRFGSELKGYNKNTGILTIDFAHNTNGGGTTWEMIGTDNTLNTTGYLRFSASKSPSLVTIPNLLPLVYSLPAVNIDWSITKLNGGIYTRTLTGNSTFTFTNPLPGQTIVVRLTNTASNFLVIWPTVKWVGALAPTMTIGAKSDIYSFIYDGTDVFGSYIQNMS